MLKAVSWFKFGYWYWKMQTSLTGLYWAKGNNAFTTNISFFSGRIVILKDSYSEFKVYEIYCCKEATSRHEICPPRHVISLKTLIHSYQKYLHKPCRIKCLIVSYFFIKAMKTLKMVFTIFAQIPVSNTIKISIT